MRLRMPPVALIVLVSGLARAADEAPPRSLDPRFKVELFAENPQIVTPTGIDIDARGRVWAIESNTHFPPEGYKGHAGDRVLVMSDTDGDGKADRIVPFKEGLTFSMSVAVRPAWLAPRVEESKGRKVKESASAVYLATRREIVLYDDDDGDDRADREQRIIRHETVGDYPHDGLAGIAFDALGWLYFGCGENLGADYKMIGSDGTTLAGGGEGGSIYRCRLDGTKLQRFATGFWNPHASCFDAFGRLFSVDNDADSRPPCRLMHIIQDGDYGYRYRNGRKGLHPFTAWNGEIAGTLPMVAGTGEAPSGVLACESDRLPDDFAGNLLATSWGDHRIDRFRLQPRGASFESLAEPLIVGGENFRPVGIACAPDGCLYFTDWVLRDYNLHSRGRVWRISPTQPSAEKPLLTTDISSKAPLAQLDKLLDSRRIDLRRASATALRATKEGRSRLRAALADSNRSLRARIESLWSIALVPLADDVMVGDSPELWSSLLEMDEVGQAVCGLIGTPQFPVKSYRAAKSLPMREASGPADFWSRLDSKHATSLLASLPATRHFSLGGLAVFMALAQPDPFLFTGAVNRLTDNGPEAIERMLAAYAAGKPMMATPVPRIEIAVLLAARRLSDAGVPLMHVTEALRRALVDRDETIRRAAVQWIAESRMKELRPEVEAIFNDPAISADLFLATLAALEMLDGVPPQNFDQTPPGKYVLPMVKDDQRPPAVRALALRLVDPADPALDAGLLESLVQSADPALRLEAVRTLQQSPVAQASRLLISIAAADRLDENLRAEAVLGLARGETDGRPAAATRELLLKLLSSNDAALRREALRSLRGFVAADSAVKEAVAALARSEAGERQPLKDEIALAEKPAGAPSPTGASREGLLEPTRDGDDSEAGRRTFYHANSAGCARCHTVNGRGGRIGPDLSTIGKALSRERIIDSILEPSREIAPQFVAWSFETTEGKVHTGMIVHENEGKTVLGDGEGKLTELKTIDIVQRVPQKASVMPDKLADRMTLQEFRDLLAFLESLK